MQCHRFLACLLCAVPQVQFDRVEDVPGVRMDLCTTGQFLDRVGGIPGVLMELCAIGQFLDQVEDVTVLQFVV